MTSTVSTKSVRLGCNFLPSHFHTIPILSSLRSVPHDPSQQLLGLVTSIMPSFSLEISHSTPLAALTTLSIATSNLFLNFPHLTPNKISKTVTKYLEASVLHFFFFFTTVCTRMIFLRRGPLFCPCQCGIVVRIGPEGKLPFL